MIFLLCFGVLLFSIVLPVLTPKKDNFIIGFTQIAMLTLITATISYAVYEKQTLNHYLLFLEFDHINLGLQVQFDNLAKIMMIFILVIGFFIYRYAQNYLESDQTRIRFLSQLNLVLCSVILLAVSANLFTAFVAWQFIGINLYILLNHYHNDPYANKAAKKKFVINRIGDCSFLLAMLLAYQTSADTTFSNLYLSHHCELICGLLIVSVMTKCAQFPFHIWLLDTMETPTPVSALMHAGVINAGGILLTRLSGTLVTFHALTYLVLAIGLSSAVLSIGWMNHQPDIKKKLAYSTMGQMGYMLMQCSLGAFPAAIFHLMSHGFYKASLFLNAGETLLKNKKEPGEKISGKEILKSLPVALIIFIFGLILFRDHGSHIPVLMYGFILLTLITLVLKAQFAGKGKPHNLFMHYLVISVIYFSYFVIFHIFSCWLPHYEYPGLVPVWMQLCLSALVFLVQFLVWTKKLSFPTSFTKDNTEQFFRHYALTPLRVVGSIINEKKHEKHAKIVYQILVFFTLVMMLYGLLSHNSEVQLSGAINSGLILCFLLIGIVTLVVANRCLSIRSLIISLILFELNFANLAWFDGHVDMVKVGVFHLMNISLVLLSLSLLASKKSLENNRLEKESNRLPTRVFYLTFNLLLLIGIPGTASFISEFYLLNTLIGNGVLFVLMYMTLIVLLAIVVMHSLQLYVFNKGYASLLSSPISKQAHIVFLTLIFINIVSGIQPKFLLNII